MKIYVGNLSYRTTENDLREKFEMHDNVNTVDIITDRETGRSKGFGFVEMNDNDEANEAINALNGYDLAERTLNVNEARPREERSGNGRSRQFSGSRERRY